MAVAASKGLATPVAGPVGALMSAARKRRLIGGWLATVPVTMPAGAPTAAAATKEPTAGPVGAFVLAATKEGPIEGWGRTAVVAPVVVPAGAPTTATTSTARSREAAAVA
jgi:hypothetical protein